MDYFDVIIAKMGDQGDRNSIPTLSIPWNRYIKSEERNDMSNGLNDSS